ncbi:MAG: metal-dependent hydrolase [Ferrimicrobium acidiphilum]
MLGRDHLLLAGVAGVALLPVIAPTEFHNPAVLGISTVIVAGFGLLPDIDEPGSMVSRKLGFVSRAFSHVVRALAGGHRKLTHSLLFILLIWVLAYEADLRWGTWTTCVMFVITASLTLKYLLPDVLRRIHILILAIIIGGGYFAWLHPVAPIELASLAAAGTFLHIFGDALTVEGVPFLFPLGIQFRFPIVGHTERKEDGPFNREHLLGIALAIAFVVFAWLNIVKPSIADVGSSFHTEITRVQQTVSSVTKSAPSTSAIVSSAQNSVVTAESWINSHIR